MLVGAEAARKDEQAAFDGVEKFVSGRKITLREGRENGHASFDEAEIRFIFRGGIRGGAHHVAKVRQR